MCSSTTTAAGWEAVRWKCTSGARFDSDHLDRSTAPRHCRAVTEAIAETLEAKLHAWRPETSQRVREMVAEIIELADSDSLDLGRSRQVEQEVLDILDGPAAW